MTETLADHPETSEGLVCIDAGEGFQNRLAEQRKHIKTFDSTSRLRVSKLSVILLTYGHMDHTWVCFLD